MRQFLRLMRSSGCMFILLIISDITVSAQEYEIEGFAGQTLKGEVKLTLYDGDTTYRTYVARISDGRFMFSGKLRSKTLAEIQMPMYPSHFIYVEPGKMSIIYDNDITVAPRVNGSRSNSEYRYLLERCHETEFESCIVAYIQANPTSIFCPFLIYNHLKSIDVTKKESLMNGLSGEAKETYHYHMLKKRLTANQALSKGAKFPDIGIPFHPKNKELRQSHKGKYVVFSVGASWCEQCNRAENQIDSIISKNDEVVHFNVKLDDDKRGWDAPYIQELAIEYIPYIIVIDPEGCIVARDTRYWELYKHIPNIHQ